MKGSAMNRFTPFIDQPGRRTGFFDGLVVGALGMAVFFAGGAALAMLFLLR